VLLEKLVGNSREGRDLRNEYLKSLLMSAGPEPLKRNRPYLA